MLNLQEGCEILHFHTAGSTRAWKVPGKTADLSLMIGLRLGPRLYLLTCVARRTNISYRCTLERNTSQTGRERRKRLKSVGPSNFTWPSVVRQTHQSRIICLFVSKGLFGVRFAQLCASRHACLEAKTAGVVLSATLL